MDAVLQDLELVVARVGQRPDLRKVVGYARRSATYLRGRQRLKRLVVLHEHICRVDDLLGSEASGVGYVRELVGWDSSSVPADSCLGRRVEQTNAVDCDVRCVPFRCSGHFKRLDLGVVCAVVCGCVVERIVCDRRRIGQKALSRRREVHGVCSRFEALRRREGRLFAAKVGRVDHSGDRRVPASEAAARHAKVLKPAVQVHVRLNVVQRGRWFDACHIVLGHVVSCEVEHGGRPLLQSG